MINRLLLIMKLVFFLMLCFTLCAKSNTIAQNLTLNISNETLQEVMLKVKDQAGLNFFFRGADIAETKISANIKDMPLKVAMNMMLKENGLNWSQKDGVILITAAKRSNLKTEITDNQTYKFAGNVLDENNKALAGATINVKGTNQYVTTDNNGNFTIDHNNSRATLIISMLGYHKEEFLAHAEQKNTIRMKVDNSDIDEVIVVGFGTQKRENLTGAVSTIDVSKQLEGRSIPDVGRGLQGAAPGLTITVPDGEVGTDPRFRIRGAIGSIDGGASPLILLDNVEIPSIQVVNPDDIESISVLKDAASSSIYGAKAAFGVILITSKKGAKNNRNTLSYTGIRSHQDLAKAYEMSAVEGLQYMLDARAREKDVARTGHYSYDGLYVGSYFAVNEKSLQKSYEWMEKYGNTLGADDPYVYGRDWYTEGGRNYGIRPFNIYDHMIRENAPTYNHNFSMNGKSNNTTYNMGLGYVDQSGMMKTAKDDSFTKYNATTRVETKVNDWMHLRSGVVFSSRSKKHPFLTESGSDGPWLYLYRWSPLVPLGYDEEGKIIRSPESETAQAATANIKYSYTNFNGGITIEPINKWISKLDYAYSNQEHIHTLPGSTLSGANYRGTPVRRLDSNGQPIYVNFDGQVVDASAPDAMISHKLPYEENYNGSSKPNLFKREHENSYRHTLNVTTEYSTQLSDVHDFKVLLGMNLSTYNYSEQSTQVTELSDFQNPQFSFGTGTWTGGGGAGWDAQLGYFGRVNYAFKDKYLLEGNLRYDGTSKFPTDLRWKWFPSFSAGWRLDQESFMQWMTPTISSFKLRTSWGSIGDQTVSSSLYIPTMQNGQNNWIGGNGSLLSYVGTPSAVSAAITWQSIETLDFGLDTRFFNGKMGLTLDWFRRDTRNMIVRTDGINEITYGGSAPKANNGSLRSKGWELALDANHRFNNGLGINMMFMVADVKSTITKFGDTKNINDYYVGKNYGEIWGFKSEGLYQWDDFETTDEGNLIFRKLTADDTIDDRAVGKDSYILKKGTNGEAPVYQTFFQGSSFFFGPGDVKFIDVNGDGILSKGTQTLDDKGDLVVIGNETPRYEYSTRIGADFKGVDISLFFQGIGKRQMWGDGPLAISGWKTSDGAMAAAFAKNYWTIDNTDAFYPAAYNMAGANSSYNMNINDRYLLNMAYLRLKNLTIGYSVPNKMLEKVKINKLRVYMTGENLITWDKLRGLPLDPELVTGYSMWGSNFSQGRTGVSTPAFKTFSFGVQVNL